MLAVCHRKQLTASYSRRYSALPRRISPHAIVKPVRTKINATHFTLQLEAGRRSVATGLECTCTCACINRELTTVPREQRQQSHPTVACTLAPLGLPVRRANPAGASSEDARSHWAPTCCASLPLSMTNTWSTSGHTTWASCVMTNLPIRTSSQHRVPPTVTHRVMPRSLANRRMFGITTSRFFSTSICTNSLAHG